MTLREAVDVICNAEWQSLGTDKLAAAFDALAGHLRDARNDTTAFAATANLMKKFAAALEEAKRPTKGTNP